MSTHTSLADSIFGTTDSTPDKDKAKAEEEEEDDTTRSILSELFSSKAIGSLPSVKHPSNDEEDVIVKKKEEKEEEEESIVKEKPSEPKRKRNQSVQKANVMEDAADVVGGDHDNGDVAGEAVMGQKKRMKKKRTSHADKSPSEAAEGHDDKNKKQKKEDAEKVKENINDDKDDDSSSSSSSSTSSNDDSSTSNQEDQQEITRKTIVDTQQTSSFNSNDASDDDQENENNNIRDQKGQETSTKTAVEHKKHDEEESRTIFVGNLPPDITRKGLIAIFNKTCGKVQSARLRSVPVAGVKLPPEKAGNQNLMRKVCVNTSRLNPDAPKKTAQGYVVFQAVHSVEKALRMNNQPMPLDFTSTSSLSSTSTLRLRVDTAKPTIDPSRSVFVGNLPYNADEVTLQNHFIDGYNYSNNDNDIVNVRVIRDNKTMQCKGFGYVILRDKSLVPAALRMHETMYMKRIIRVLVCGKRLKGRRGGTVLPKKSKKKEEETERTRSTQAGNAVENAFDASRRVAIMKKTKTKHQKSTNDLAVGSRMTRKRKLPSERNARKKNLGVKKAGISKRAAAKAKLGKRVKKIQKRIGKGMGKARKGQK